MLDAVIHTSHETIRLIQGIRDLMRDHKHTIRNELPKIYSQDLLNTLFRHPYTKIEFIIQELGIHRNTASKYLEELVRVGILSKHRIVKENFYINRALFEHLCQWNSD